MCVHWAAEFMAASTAKTETKRQCVALRAVRLLNDAYRITATHAQYTEDQVAVSFVRTADGIASQPSVTGSMIARATTAQRAAIEGPMKSMFAGSAPSRRTLMQGDSYDVSADINVSVFP